MSKPIRILCVDDHPLMRDGIAFALQSQKDMELVGQAVDGEEALRLYRDLRPDVTLMDLQMPGVTGMTAIENILADFPRAKIIVLTTYSGDALASRALRAGVVGYLLKGMLRTELIGTIRAVYQGGRRIPPEIASEVAEHICADALSEREIEVLRSVARGNANKIVADELDITEDTVKGHMKNILSKLGANDRTHAVLIAMKRGFFDA
jgi:DNA-binding NarL/FixJ family response regulator